MNALIAALDKLLANGQVIPHGKWRTSEGPRGHWSGTAARLMKELVFYTDFLRARDRPRDEKQLKAVLRDQGEALADAGIHAAIAGNRVTLLQEKYAQEEQDELDRLLRD